MTLTDEQVKYIKEQLLKQTEKFPEDKKKEAIDYINSMNNEEIESFLKKNQAMAKEQDSQPIKEKSTTKKSLGDCVYCLISNKQMESLSIYEDKDYLAALEINPFSEGHVILISKKHIKETKGLKTKSFSIADKIGKHLVKQLKAENFQISTSDDLKHAIINIIPTYKGEKLSFERKPADKKYLQQLAIKIGEMKKRTTIKKPKKESNANLKKQTENLAKNILQLPRRVP
ncbi:MAG: HIT family protein [archaeon]|nr:HIT family protein [archaeon]